MRVCASVCEKGVSEVVVKACFFFGSISVFARLRFKFVHVRIARILKEARKKEEEEEWGSL